jgi:23S rRNA (cytosine1962-C5)-methyltransferase
MTMLDTPFCNRLRKNHRHFGKWARRAGIQAYRIYDHDLDEHPLAVDLYGPCVHAQEYERQRPLEESAHEAWLSEITVSLSGVLAVDPSDIFFKRRRRLKRLGQYDLLSDERRELVVEEAGPRFLVNLSDRLDTGLFLDHRATRAMVGEMARDKRVLNLFAYTASFSVYAARGGASATTSVDLSNTYLAWAERNFELNGVRGEQHELLRMDVNEFLDHALARRARYDLIVVDPPTYSKSKMARQDFDVQRDHERLLRQCLRLLAPAGEILFSTNFRRFRMAPQLAADAQVRDITARTIPPDFRDRKIHSCYLVRAGRAGR